MGFASDFLDAMEYLIQKYQKECATIYSGTVQSVSDKSCSMNVNGNVYNKIAYYGVAPIVGNSYRVFAPFNNMSLAFIIIPSTATSGSSGVSSVNGKTGDVVLNAADVGALSSTTIIPDKTSQLVNDSGFITDSALSDYAKKTEIPTKTSQLNNDSGYINKIPIASKTALGGVIIGDGLTVDANGVVSSEENTFICTVTATQPYTCDKSSTEIYNAQIAGKIVICRYAMLTIPLITATTQQAIFRGLGNYDSLKGIKIVINANKTASISQMLSGDSIVWDSIDLTNAELDPSLGTWEEYIPGVYKLNVADYPENYVVGAMITQFTDGGDATGKIPQVMLINGSLSIMVASDAPVIYNSIQILVAHI